MTEDDNEMKWRDLALQFDGHRMQAISFLKMILSELPDDQYVSARDFIKAGPLSGEEVLRNRIAALTQPASPALKLPDEMDTDHPRMRWVGMDELWGRIQGWDDCLEEVKRLNAPHTAPIEPICATGGAEWVKCSARLPEENEEVIAFIAQSHEYKGKAFPGVRYEEYWWLDGEMYSYDEVSHWQPMPAAPVE